MRPGLNIVALAGACLVAGMAIGLKIPRPAQPAPTQAEQASPARPDPRSVGRNVYSPIVLKDEHVRRKHFEIVDMLERQCRATGENCQLARSARRAMSEPK